MKTLIKSITLAMALAASCCASSLSGVFIYKYQNGPTYRVTIPDVKSLEWECIEGSEKGAKGHESPIRHTISDDIYFLSWIEKTGIIVTQVVNLKSRKVYSTVVEGKERYVLEGDIVKQ